MANMSKERMGEIALAILIAKFEHEGLNEFGPNLRRSLGKISADTGVPLQDLEDFSKEMLVRVLMKTYGVKHVSLRMNDEPPTQIDKQ